MASVYVGICCNRNILYSEFLLRLVENDAQCKGLSSSKRKLEVFNDVLESREAGESSLGMVYVC